MDAITLHGPDGPYEEESFAGEYLMYKPFDNETLNVRAKEAIGMYWSDHAANITKLMFQVANVITEWPSTTTKFIFCVATNKDRKEAWITKLAKHDTYCDTLQGIEKILEEKNFATDVFTTMKTIDCNNNTDIQATEKWSLENLTILRTLVPEEYNHVLYNILSKTKLDCKEMAYRSLEVLDDGDITYNWEANYQKYFEPDWAMVSRSLTAEIVTYRQFYKELYEQIFEENEDPEE